MDSPHLYIPLGKISEEMEIPSGIYESQRSKIKVLAERNSKNENESLDPIASDSPK
jgi:hypothetical protein